MTEAPDRCAPFEEDLSAWLDGELDADRARELRLHLDACPRCSARLEILRGVDLRLRAMPLPAPSPELRERLLARLREGQERPATRRSAPPRRSRRWLAGPALGLVAAAAAALLLYLAVRPSPRLEPAGAPAPPIAVEEPASPVPPTPLEPLPDGQLALERPSLQVLPELRPERPAPPDAPEVPAYELELLPLEPLREAALAERTPRGREAPPELIDEAPEDLAVVLLEVEEPEDVDVIANLELLERLLELEAGRG